jgi:hypothetical protein
MLEQAITEQYFVLSKKKHHLMYSAHSNIELLFLLRNASLLQQGTYVQRPGKSQFNKRTLLPIGNQPHTHTRQCVVVEADNVPAIVDCNPHYGTR